ncbi:hypothetical protein [Serratia marcescens]|uniref:hypothetical protein n=1 Tax=Serratia TaxID=613 RepID=UPI0011B9F915|nr:hypothetical protein [Serratia marcescens]TWY37550.1 hypothetical protein FR992_15705 [Serratia marcescens]TYR90305.1 hypothetical protein FYK38_08230 [Serratia marcescens]HAU4336821.1 hypothetical protein [Serratia marcescens]
MTAVWSVKQIGSLLQSLNIPPQVTPGQRPTRALHGNQYCQGALGESLIDFPQRQDRTFSYTQAFNACYVYGEIVRYRRKVAQHLSTEYQTKELTWINEALDSATMMRFNLAERLYHVRDVFFPPWKSLIEEWQFENETGKYFNSEETL